MAKHEENLINILKNELKSRNNPIDLKPVYIGKVVNLSPVQVAIYDDNFLKKIAIKSLKRTIYPNKTATENIRGD